MLLISFNFNYRLETLSLSRVTLRVGSSTCELGRAGAGKWEAHSILEFIFKILKQVMLMPSN